MTSVRVIPSFIVPEVNIYTYIITTEDTESTEGLCPYFLYSVFSGLSVVKLSLEIGEGIWVLDYSYAISSSILILSKPSKTSLKSIFKPCCGR